MREIIDNLGRTPARILKDEKVLFGDVFPAELDELLCAKNPRLCKSKRISKQSPKLNNSSCGYDVTGFNMPAWAAWTNKIGDHIWIPDFNFKPLAQFKPVTISVGMPIDELLSAHKDACALFKVVDCWEATKQNNDLIWGEVQRASFKGRLNLPIFNVSTEVNIAKDAKLFSELKPNLSIPAPLNRESLTVTFDPEVAGRLTALHDRVAKSLAIPSVALVSTGSDRVGILDGWADKDHCLINHTLVQVHDHSQVTIQPADCATFLPAGDKDEEHATHLLGMLAALPEVTKGQPDVILPLARNQPVSVYEVNGASFNPQDAFTRLLGTESGLIYSDRSIVYNMSFTYTAYAGYFDPFEDWVTKPNIRALFVAASGQTGVGPNQQSTFSEAAGCNIDPVCRTAVSPKVISVVGLTDDLSHPDVLPGTHFGTLFDVGAPGESIPSTFRGNRIGLLSGSSQSTVFVAGIAALIYEKNENLSPIQVRNRLIATSDIFPHLYNKIFGGRINVTRALDVDHDVITAKRNTVVSYNGTQIQLGNLPSDLISDDIPNLDSVSVRGEIIRKCLAYIFLNEVDNQEVVVNAFQILRLWRNPDNQQIYLYYMQPEEKRPKSGRAARAILLNDFNATGRLITLRIPDYHDGPVRIDIPIESVNDFVAETVYPSPDEDWNGARCPKKN